MILLGLEALFLCLLPMNIVYWRHKIVNLAETKSKSKIIPQINDKTGKKLTSSWLNLYIANTLQMKEK